MKYGIRLISKHTGEEVAVLGVPYDTIEATQAAADKLVCSRCNRWELEYIPEGATWVNKKRGFVTLDELKRIRQQYRENKSEREIK